MKQFPARMQSEDALAAQLAALGLQDGRVQAPAASDEAGDLEPDLEPDDTPPDTPADTPEDTPRA